MGFEEVKFDSASTPAVIVLAGPNGAGKSTSAPILLPHALGIVDFVNADVIASGLSAFAADRVALQASEIMLSRIRALTDARSSFAFETTLAARSPAQWLRTMTAQGYEFHLIFLWLSSADAAVARVAERVLNGGHDVPEATIRRRYDLGLRNFFDLYQPLTTTWQLYDNSGEGNPRPLAAGMGVRETQVFDPATWLKIEREFGGARTRGTDTP